MHYGPISDVFSSLFSCERFLLHFSVSILFCLLLPHSFYFVSSITLYESIRTLLLFQDREDVQPWLNSNHNFTFALHWQIVSPRSFVFFYRARTRHERLSYTNFLLQCHLYFILRTRLAIAWCNIKTHGTTPLNSLSLSLFLIYSYEHVSRDVKSEWTVQ